MGRLANIARNVVGAGGENMSLDKIIAKYPEGVTVNGAFQYVNKQGVVKTCFTFEEEPNHHAYAESGNLAIIFGAWLKEFGSVEALNENLQVEQVKVKILKVPKKSSSGTYVKAWVVGVVEKPVPKVSEEPTEKIDMETGEVIPF